MYIPYNTFFNIVSTIVETLVIALHQFLYPFIVECCRLRCKARGHGFFRNLSLSDTISWGSDNEIWGKCRESDVMVNHLFSLTVSSTARTKSSFTADGRPLRRSSRTFLRPSLNGRTHVTKLTINFSRFHVLHIQETDYEQRFTCGGIPYFLKHYKHTARCVNTVRMSANCVCALPQIQQTRHACAPIVTAALQHQCSQTELIFWITYVFECTVFVCNIFWTFSHHNIQKQAVWLWLSCSACVKLNLQTLTVTN